jgi:hypothetical protein
MNMFYKQFLGAAALAFVTAVLPAMAQPTAAVAGQPPARPVPPTFPAISAADCDQPARSAMLLGRDSPFASLQNAAQDYSAGWERLMDWRTAELVRRGHWRDADVQGFRERLAQNAPLMAEIRTGLGLLIGTMMPSLGTVANERRPMRERCLALATAAGALDQALASAERQWRMIADALSADAARFGVTFD